jgi:hypothetical protein
MNTTKDPHNRKSGRPFAPPQQEPASAAGFGAQHEGRSTGAEIGGVSFNNERRSASRSRSFPGGFEQQSDIFSGRP